MSKVSEIAEVVEREGGDVEEFYRVFERLKKRYRGKLSERAIALIAAKKLGVDVTDILYPPIRGRVLSIGPVKVKPDGSQYRLFTLVTENRRYLCVAFGEEHVRKLDELEDRAVKISRYVIASFRDTRIYRVTERSLMEEIPDEELPPIIYMPAAWVSSIKEIISRKVPGVIEVAVLDSDITENMVCPECGRIVEYVEETWVCAVHGSVEPEIRRFSRYHIADKSGVYLATKVGEEELPELHTAIVKAYPKGLEEVLITKVYQVKPIEEEAKEEERESGLL
ncbi:MAG: hypothetical protein DRJ52_09190 [Thermoprotei archaeon]|nr:MAG: hypothetical protein DRJ52_09190 [Thermoprotei archaeon]RLE97560.1 MAG: hypothetical protein DRJ63_08985 [Thermoprotei archaeon]